MPDLRFFQTAFILTRPSSAAIMSRRAKHLEPPPG